jgi:hypothetical protein
MESLLAVDRSADVAARPVGGASMRAARPASARGQRVAVAIGGGHATGAASRGSRWVDATGGATGRELADPRAGLVRRRAGAGHGAPHNARELQELAAYKRVSVRGCWRRTDDECISMRGPRVCAGRTAVNDRGRGVSRRRARASIAHNTRGQKGVMEE